MGIRLVNQFNDKIIAFMECLFSFMNESAANV